MNESSSTSEMADHIGSQAPGVEVSQYDSVSQAGSRSHSSAPSSVSSRVKAAAKRAGLEA